MSDNSQTLWLGLDCSPCFKRECPLEHHDCMKKLNPDMVMAALAPQLEKVALKVALKVAVIVKGCDAE